jgi:hypothetical protein
MTGEKYHWSENIPKNTSKHNKITAEWSLIYIIKLNVFYLQRKYVSNKYEFLDATQNDG